MTEVTNEIGSLQGWGDVGWAAERLVGKLGPHEDREEGAWRVMQELLAVQALTADPCLWTIEVQTLYRYLSLSRWEVWGAVEAMVAAKGWCPQEGYHTLGVDYEYVGGSLVVLIPVTVPSYDPAAGWPTLSYPLGGFEAASEE